MQYYEAYLDEDLDEDLIEDLDEDLDEDNDEFFEDSDESEDFGESRSSRRRRQGRQAPRRARINNRRLRRRDRGRGVGRGKPTPTPSKAAVQNAFSNVRQDVVRTQNELKKAGARQSNEQMNDLIATILFRPTLKTANIQVFDESGATPLQFKTKVVGPDGKPITIDGKEVTEVGYAVEDNLVPLLAMKMISNMKGIDSAKGVNQFLPLGVGLLLSTSAQQTLGLRDKDSTTSSLSFDNLFKNPAVLLLVAFLFMQNTKK